jgi:hypothetical protein
MSSFGLFSGAAMSYAFTFSGPAYTSGLHIKFFQGKRTNGIGILHIPSDGYHRVQGKNCRLHLYFGTFEM